MTTISHDFKRVFVWEVPVRLFHWVNFIAILVLIATGILIGNPPALISGVEATNQYWFGTNRFIHFAAAYIFTFSIAYRVIWSFIGNKYANWRVFFPFSKKRIKSLGHVLKTDILLMNPEKFKFSRISIGHNSLAAFSYLVFFMLVLIQIATGFALYADNTTWWFPKIFAWVTPLFGGDTLVRLVHHIVMWIVILFSIVHVYLVFYHDWLEGRGEVSSMFGGFKFIRKERISKPKEE
jgi:Ni/Fe-hydrogenase 1 B-type cytochrome subunit